MAMKAMSEKEASQKAQRIHKEHIVIDSLAPSFISERVLTPPMIDLS